MADRKITEIVNRLFRLTMSQEIPWATTEDDQAFQASFSSYSVRIAIEDVDDNWGKTYEICVLYLYDTRGRIIEKITPPDLSPETEDPFGVLRKIHDGARRTALGVDKKLDDILKSLNEDSEKK